MFVGLAGTGGRTTIVKSQPVKFVQTAPHGRKISQGKPTALRFKVAGYDQQVRINHIELIEQTKMGR